MIRSYGYTQAATLRLRLRNNAGKYYNFTTLAWVDNYVSACGITPAEYTQTATSSFYVFTFTPPSEDFDIEVVDTVLDQVVGVDNNAIDSIDTLVNNIYTEVTGTVAGAFTLTITALKVGGSPALSYTTFTVMNSTETTTLAVITANSNGVSQDELGADKIMLDAGTYVIYATNGGYTFTATTKTITSNDTLTMYGTALPYDAPIVAGACRVYEYCYQSDGLTPMESVTAYAKINKLPFDIGNTLHAGDIVYGTYDNTTGYLYWDFVKGAEVKFTIKDVLDPSIIRVVPNETSIRLIEME